ncbi:MAG: methyltransferase domain-containing protein [Deltaproteobacteria bacterium]|nr:methyltransferase domain-containing protein [Deltaproteobacteria bacterium]
MKQNPLNHQKRRWQETFSECPGMFGAEASIPARAAADLFKSEAVQTILELGSGQGRDTIYFAQEGFRVHALDYSGVGLESVKALAHEAGLSGRVVTKIQDVREPLPFIDGSFDACYSHMLFCMALTTPQLRFLSGEIRRVLKPGGWCIYTVRHTGDAHYRKGVERGEDLYEMGGFIVHFFSRKLVRELSQGFEIIVVDEFEEGDLPRKLFRVTQRKPS